MKFNNKHKKWIISIVIIGTFLATGTIFFQSKKMVPAKTAPEYSLARSLKKLNNDLLENPQLISGEIMAEANLTATVAGSDLKLAIQSDKTKNAFSYSGNVSAETLMYAINTLFGEEHHSDIFESISLYSQSKEVLLTDKGNQTASFLAFNSSGLNPFLKGNKQYFSTPVNVSHFHQKLEMIGIHTTFGLSETEGHSPEHRIKIDTVYVTLKEIVNLLPIKVSNTRNLNQKISFQFIQNDKAKTIEKIKVGLLDYQLDKQLNSYSKLDMKSNIVLEFDLESMEAE